MKRKYQRKAASSGDFMQFQELVEVYSKEIVNCVFVDSVVHPFEQKEKILELLNEHICNHVVKIGRNYYKQTSGIPQGSVVSSLLCSLYYGQLEKLKLAGIVDKGCLIRYIDDFLFITNDKQRAINFLEIVHSGFPEYGFQVQTSKSMINFDYMFGNEQVRNVKNENLTISNGICNLTSVSLVRLVNRYEAFRRLYRPQQIKRNWYSEINKHYVIPLLLILPKHLVRIYY
jgi:telomerase reverse transcriptase